MAQAVLHSLTTPDSIPSATQAPSVSIGVRYATKPPELDRIIHQAGARLLSLRMTPLPNGEPTKGEAQDVVRDLLNVAAIVDAALLEMGREIRSHFGSGIDLADYTDQLRDAIEGNACFALPKAVEDEGEARSLAAADARRDLFRDWGTLPAHIERMVAAE